jgi:adaptin ear-binding coat-associated protein 1/2
VATAAGLFAACPVYVNHPKMGTTVESVVDSSRYFVLRLDDGKGNRAFVGLGFSNREEAFDFKVAMQEHEKYVIEIFSDKYSSFVQASRGRENDVQPR